MPDLSEDRTSGSSDVAAAFLAQLRQWTDVDTSPSGPALRAALLRLLRESQAAQPTMALIHQLGARALDVTDTGLRREDSAVELRGQITASCIVEGEDLIQSTKAVARTARALVSERKAWIATLSSSGAVHAALTLCHEDGLEPQALVAEGRPMLEGRAMATRLAAAGIPTWLVTDAALPMLLGSSRMVWIGADAVTERGVINKVGSFATALAAREHSVPVYALASRRKFLPAGTPALKIVEQSPDEVWDAPPAGVRPRNVYFELVPMALIRGIVVEDGVLGASEAGTVALERPLPKELAAE